MMFVSLLGGLAVDVGNGSTTAEQLELLHRAFICMLDQA
jgi:hypothetical protein